MPSKRGRPRPIPRLPRGVNPGFTPPPFVSRPRPPRRVPRTGDMISVDTFGPRPGQMVPDGGVDLPDFNPMPPPAAPWAQAPGFYESDMIGRGPGPDGGPMPIRPPIHPAFPPGFFNAGPSRPVQLPPGLFNAGPTSPIDLPPQFMGPTRPSIPPGLIEALRGAGGTFRRPPRRPTRRRFGAY